MNFFEIDNLKIAYSIFGTGKKTVVVDTAISTCSAEWWHIAEELSRDCKVLVFDRAGYGQREKPKSERTPQNIAVELNNLLVSLDINENIILLGHSQGGFYALQYALMYSSKVDGIVLLDPATPYDSVFVERLTKDEYKKSGVDKTLGMKLGLLVSSIKLGRLVKPMFRKMPPFYYYKFSEEAEKYLLNSLYRKNTYKTSLDEYKYTHRQSATEDLKNAIESNLLNDIPLRLITHSSEFYAKELREFGNMDAITADKIEDIWQEIMKRTLNISTNTQHVIANNSGHYIHLTDLKIVLDNVKTLL